MNRKIFISSQNLKRQTALILDVKRGSEYHGDRIAPLGLTAVTRGYDYGWDETVANVQCSSSDRNQHRLSVVLTHWWCKGTCLRQKQDVGHRLDIQHTALKVLHYARLQTWPKEHRLHFFN